jgi:hypothetical protein
MRRRRVKQRPALYPAPMPPRTVASLAAAIRKGLQAASDPAYRDSIARLVPGIRTWGVRVPVLRTEAAEAAKGDPPPTFEEACALLDRFTEEGWRDEILFATFLVARFRRQIPTLPWKTVARWAERVDNWETCDQIAMGIAAPRVAAAPAEGIRGLKQLARAASPWTRRFAVATAAALNQRGRSFPAETLEICELLVDEKDPNVRKAVAWAMRAAGKPTPPHRKAIRVSS